MRATATIIRISDKAMKIAADAELRFAQTGHKMPDGTWQIAIGDELHEFLANIREPGETVSDTIIRAMQAATGAKPS